MELSFRAAAPADFAAFYEACFPRDRGNTALREVVAHEWRVLLENPATLSFVAEDAGRAPERRLVGCGQLAFVTDGFVRRARSDTASRVNVQATHPLPDGSWPLLTPLEVARANGGAGLNGLFTRWTRATLPPDELRLVGRFMHDAGLSQTRGYQFKELLIEAIGEAARDSGLHAGFLQRRSLSGPQDDLPAAKRPFLMGLTREEAHQREGSVMGHYFIHCPPRFGFTARQQEMLRLSLRHPELSDEALAEALGVSVGAAKNWWKLVYERVSKADPDLLPLVAGGRARGPEKRRRLLQYLREHPEELRPYKPRGGKGCPQQPPEVPTQEALTLEQSAALEAGRAVRGPCREWHG